VEPSQAELGGPEPRRDDGAARCRGELLNGGRWPAAGAGDGEGGREGKRGGAAAATCAE